MGDKVFQLGNKFVVFACGWIDRMPFVYLCLKFKRHIVFSTRKFPEGEICPTCKKEEEKKPKISAWVSKDLEIDQQKKREEEAEERELPHPVE